MTNQTCVKGKGCISAKIIADSVAFNSGKRIITFEIEYPRFILAELAQHRVFSKSSSSSRAQPIKNVIEQILNNPSMPLFWGKNQSGMQAIEEIENYDKFGQGEYQWLGAMTHAIERAKTLSEQGYHKQIVNRILEPFQVMKTVITATEFDNFLSSLS